MSKFNFTRVIRTESDKADAFFKELVKIHFVHIRKLIIIEMTVNKLIASQHTFFKITQLCNFPCLSYFSFRDSQLSIDYR